LVDRLICFSYNTEYIPPFPAGLQVFEIKLFWGNYDKRYFIFKTGHCCLISGKLYHSDHQSEFKEEVIH
jgi:hypothetical protein